MNANQAYAVVGSASAIASVLLGWGSIKTLSQITDSGMWAIAAMTLAPALMGIGASLFICLSQRSNPAREPQRRPLDALEDIARVLHRSSPPPDNPSDAGAIMSKDR